MIFALFSRPASACRAIARCMVGGSSMSFRDSCLPRPAAGLW